MTEESKSNKPTFLMSKSASELKQNVFKGATEQYKSGGVGVMPNMQQMDPFAQRFGPQMGMPMGMGMGMGMNIPMGKSRPLPNSGFNNFGPSPMGIKNGPVPNKGNNQSFPNPTQQAPTWTGPLSPFNTFRSNESSRNVVKACWEILESMVKDDKVDYDLTQSNEW
jgi:hypothetical protein